MRDDPSEARRAQHRVRAAGACLLGLLAAGPIGCRSPASHRHAADRAADRNIARAQELALGRTEVLSVERPADTLRRRLLLDELLPYASEASLGVRDLPATRLWMPDRHLDEPEHFDGGVTNVLSGPLGLLEALQVAARNSRAFQQAKEDVFTAALDLDLEAQSFRSVFAGMVSGRYESDGSGEERTDVAQGGASLEASRAFRGGIETSSRIMVDVVKLLTQDAASSLGLMADASISIPLLRGAGRDIAAEPLRQAERDLLYAVHTFERFKQTFAVQIAGDYLAVLQNRRQIANSEENYRRLAAATRRARRLADAGRLPEFQFDQAVQDELRARTRWIDARQRYASDLDAFKVKLGLPPDTPVELDGGELERLQALAQRFAGDGAAAGGQQPSRGASGVFAETGAGRAGPLEIEPEQAMRLALDMRLDLRTAQFKVEDAQRRVYVAADALRGELTLLGRAQAGSRRTSAAGAGEPNATLEPRRGIFSGILTLDLPLDRAAERAAYRKSLLSLEASVRAVQETEDDIKLSVLDNLRSLLRARENLLIQLEAMRLAEKRVHSTDLLLQAGRAAIRDVLEAEEALLNARNALTAAMVGYRTAELSLQRDMGVLQVGADGIWSEYVPGEKGS